ncbi:MAG TPA: hypothetical protein DCO75_12535, partial [Fibrobacteres bacterium]|nr:hypothetical protein [Fibrobacterota bacterium]
MKNSLFCMTVMILIGLFSYLSAGEPAAEQFEIDYSKSKDTAINFNFKTDCSVLINNFKKNSKIIITSQYGSPVTVSSDNSGFDSDKERMSIKLKVKDDNIFINDESVALVSGNLVFSKGDTKLLTIKKIRTDDAAMLAPALKHDNIKPTGYPLIDAYAILKCDSIGGCIAVLSYYFDSIKVSHTNKWQNARASIRSQNNNFFSDTVKCFPLKLLDGKKKNVREEDNAMPIGGNNSSLKNNLGISSLVSSVGGLDVTTLADGLSKFIVKRTKTELSIAFFDKFKKDLDNYPDLQKVFPQTCKILTAIGDEIYAYSAYIQALRDAFRLDICSLPTNLPKIIDNHNNYFAKNEFLRAELLTAFYMADAIQTRKHPGEIIENYPISYLDHADTNIKAGFQILKLISLSLKDASDTGYWASLNEINNLAQNDTLLQIYLGLVVQKARMDPILYKDRHSKSSNFGDMLNKSYINFVQYKDWIKSLAVKIGSLDSKIRNIKDMNSDSIAIEKYYDVVSSGIGLMQFVVTFDKLPFIASDSLKLTEATAPYFDLASSADNMIIDVNRKNYSSAIVNAEYIIRKVFDSSEIINYHKVNNSSKEDKILRDVVQKFIKYGTFVANIAQADSSDEVEAAIEAIALPSGSARIKKESSFNVALNAYCGFFAGWNLKDGVDYATYGITAPV